MICIRLGSKMVGKRVFFGLFEFKVDILYSVKQIQIQVSEFGSGMQLGLERKNSKSREIRQEVFGRVQEIENVN